MTTNESDYSARTLCGLAAAALTHVGRLSPRTVQAAVQDHPERAVELFLLCEIGRMFRGSLREGDYATVRALMR